MDRTVADLDIENGIKFLSQQMSDYLQMHWPTCCRSSVSNSIAALQAFVERIFSLWSYDSRKKKAHREISGDASIS